MKDKINFEEYREVALWGSVVSSLLLLIAMPTFVPYGYYQFLRLFIMLAALTLSAIFNTGGVNKILAWIFLLTAILFNAFYPIHLEK